MPEATVLDTILAHKREEVATRSTRRPLKEIVACLADAPAPRDFVAALCAPHHGSIGLIAEVKKASPSAGIVRDDFDPISIAHMYERGGADCLSVLTDERFFQGHDQFLVGIRTAVSLPILRKDFVIDAYQVYEARALGADAILLIAAALTSSQLTDYQALAHQLGMAALVEVHTPAEMQTAITIRAGLIGINSRDLKTFVTDLGVVETLAVSAPKDVTLVAESGIKTHADVDRVAAAGAKAVLVGETLMRSHDIGKAISDLLR